MYVIQGRENYGGENASTGWDTCISIESEYKRLRKAQSEDLKSPGFIELQCACFYGIELARVWLLSKAQSEDLNTLWNRVSVQNQAEKAQEVSYQ